MARTPRVTPTTRNVLIGLGVGALLALVAVLAFDGGTERDEVDLGTFQTRIDAGLVESATLLDVSDVVQGTFRGGQQFTVTFPDDYTDEITQQLLDAGVDLQVDTQDEPLWQTLLYELLPLVVLIGAFLYLMSTMGGGSGAMRFGRMKARRPQPDQPTVTFADVAGADEAVEELREIKDFLAEPERFRAMGAKIPKGVLLFGPPGTGKTLLARAVAGEAGAPFFSISGSDFVEMFVGVGASRVRDLFEQAKSSAPSIIFVDEIDAVGRHRGGGIGGGHDEREQTLNQLLVEMDGFDAAGGVLLIAATNRPDILDPALLRPGRFDRQIVVDRPDLIGRKAILAVHAEGKPLGPGVDLDIVARRTPGFTGADLANLLNEAALLATRRGLTVIGPHELDEAVERVMAGPERRSKVLSDKEKRVIAYHEAGHALVGHVLPNTDPIHKVSIIARGRALGWTLALPTEDRMLKTRAELRDEMAMLMGGRTAEELIFGDPTTGAMNDIERATEIARAMVTQFGMSDAIGPQQLGRATGETFLGREMPGRAEYSDQMAATIDVEVRLLLDEARTEAREIILQHRAVLDRLADALVDQETLGDEALTVLFGDLSPWEPNHGISELHRASPAPMTPGPTSVAPMNETAGRPDTGPPAFGENP